jgi:hypothetical protein
VSVYTATRVKLTKGVTNDKGFARELFYAGKVAPAKAQRRKALPRFSALSFAPLREKCFLSRQSLMTNYDQ